MKHIFFLLIAAAAFVGCKDDNKGQLDPNAMISLRPAAGVKADEGNPNHLSALEIVKQTNGIYLWNKNISTQVLARGFHERQRDYVTPRLLMFGTDIISQRGEYVPDVIEAEDVILCTDNEAHTQIVDTIAYIPNQVMRDAQKVIKAAYDAGDYTTVYAEFDKAFTFIPITGAEWLELKRQGKN